MPMKATYDAHETERMRELDGRPLATFGRAHAAGPLIIQIEVSIDGSPI